MNTNDYEYEDDGYETVDFAALLAAINAPTITITKTTTTTTTIKVKGGGKGRGGNHGFGGGNGKAKVEDNGPKRYDTAEAMCRGLYGLSCNPQFSRKRRVGEVMVYEYMIERKVRGDVRFDYVFVREDAVQGWTPSEITLYV